MKEKEEDEEAEEDPPLPLLTLPIESAIKWPIMDGFQILRCLQKRLDKMLQSIILEFSKTASLVAKNVNKKLLRFFLVQYMPH